MAQLLILLAVALVAAVLVFGVTVLITGGDKGLEPAEPDGRAVPLPGARPLTEADLDAVRFDTAIRGYRMAQVDQALRRTAYDLGYKEELIGVLEAEVTALREGRFEEAEQMRVARERARQVRDAEPPDPATFPELANQAIVLPGASLGGPGPAPDLAVAVGGPGQPLAEPRTQPVPAAGPAWGRADVSWGRPDGTQPTAPVPTDTIPSDTVPSDTIPRDSVPTDTVPTDTIPTGAVPGPAALDDPAPGSVEGQAPADAAEGGAPADPAPSGADGSGGAAPMNGRSGSPIPAAAGPEPPR
jgi:DivIVA domain-containing protein